MPVQLGKRSNRQSSSSSFSKRPRQRAPHAHAHIHDDKDTVKSQSRPSRSSKRQRTSDVDIYEASDADDENLTEKKNPRFDFDSQENYQYELPDNYEDEEIDEDGRI